MGTILRGVDPNNVEWPSIYVFTICLSELMAQSFCYRADAGPELCGTP